MTLSWGMVAIPVQIFSGTEDGGFKRSEYVKMDDGSFAKVGRQQIVKDTGHAVSNDEIIKAVEVEGGIVEISDDEVASLIGEANGTAKVICFVKQSALFSGTYILGGLEQMRPAMRRSGKQKVFDPAATESFALLIAAMRKTASFAVVKVVARGKPKFAALLPNGDLYTLLFDEQVRERLPMPEVAFEKEALDMGMQLIEHFQKDPPELHDDATANILAYAEKKAKGEAHEVKAAASQPETQDLMSALRGAVNAAKGGDDE